MILFTEAATLALGRELGATLEPGDVIALEGPLGSGKTVLARGLLEGAGHDGEVASPTFPIVLPYDAAAMRVPVLHADLYRIEREDELDELGLDDWLGDGALVVEWPERAGPGAWPAALRLRLAPEEKARRLTAAVPPRWWARWPFRP